MTNETPVAAAAHEYYAARAAFEAIAPTLDDETSRATFRDLVEVEHAFLRTGSRCVRDVMLKVWNLIEFFEGEGSTPEVFAKEVKAFIATDAERDLIDPPADRERRENPPPIVPRQSDPFEPIVAEVDAVVAMLGDAQIFSLLQCWQMQPQDRAAIAEQITAQPESRARRIAFYAIEQASTEGET